MSKLDQQFLEDRDLRNAAKKNVLADIELLKAGWNERGFAKRVTSRIGGGALDVFEKATDTADDNRGVLSALIGAVILWFASGALLELLGAEPDTGDETDDSSGDTTGLSDLGNEADLVAETEPALPGDEYD